ncbi:hypothetical protein GXM_01735 [Nostoc sphaeroides CCNUC1]|uniref:Uncharacterized protein n=1 Tax=Nostoc sphaeroides CCNUC1 TaxID=2653204 RepID=A0A5P8VV04_9NOSO|nr:hypothetical protein GXM_01735 [Nostoc sphaeroides CCNUC1]
MLLMTAILFTSSIPIFMKLFTPKAKIPNFLEKSGILLFTAKSRKIFHIKAFWALA